MADTLYATRLDTDDSLEAMLKDHRVEGIANCTDIWAKASTLKRFAARKQWPEADAQKLDNPNRRSPRMTIPETAVVLSTFAGRQMMQRFSREYVPRHAGAAMYAETMTKIDRAVCAATDYEQVISRAFKDGPGIQGISWTRYFVDEISGPEPQLKVADIPIWSMMWPATREINLRDRPWHRWGSWWPQATVKERWSKSYDKIRTSIGVKKWSQTAADHGQSSRIPWAGQAGNKRMTQADYYDPKGRSFWIEYEEWREPTSFYTVARPADPVMSYAECETVLVQIQAAEMGSAPETAEPLSDPYQRAEMKPDEFKAFKKEHEAVHGEEVPDDKWVRKSRLAYRYAYLCGDLVLEHGDIPAGCFTFTAMAAEAIELEDKTVYIGLLEDLVDAQKLVNYMLSALVRDLQINPKGVLFVEQGLFRDKDAALTAFTSPGGVVEVPRGRMSQGGRPWEFAAGGTQPYRSMVESMLAFYREAIPRLAGFNPAALGQLGSDLRRISGQVVRSVQDAAMVSNAERYDALRLHEREGGRIMLAFFRMLYKTAEDLIAFIGEDAAYEDVIDPATGEPVLDEMGQPSRRLAIPPPDMWVPQAWKEIAIEEAVPTDDEQSAFWDKLQTQIQLLTSPMADTGQPLMSSEDLVEVLPNLTAPRRHKMMLRIKQQMTQMRRQRAEQAAMQAQGQEGAPVEEEVAA